MQHGDNTCLIANCPASCQHLLSMVSDWLQWSGMKVMIHKCQMLSLQGSTGKLINPNQMLDGASIPFSSDPVRFLGMEVQVPQNNISARETILSNLHRMLSATSLMRRQKLLLYSGGVCPRLTWLLLIQQLPTSWMEQQVNMVDTSCAHWHTWGKNSSDICPLCQQSRQSLPHVLNNFPAAMDLRCYSKRHDEVLQVLGDLIRARLPPYIFITIDAPSASYCFPSHITPTSLRPDIVWWCENLRELWLLELTISYESVVADARERKRSKYYDLVEARRAAGYRCELITVEVGSRGMLSVADLQSLQAAIDAPRRGIVNLCLTIIQTTTLQSFWNWGCRNYNV